MKQITIITKLLYPKQKNLYDKYASKSHNRNPSEYTVVQFVVKGITANHYIG